MRDVTAATAGDTHFLEKVRAAFEDNHAFLRRSLNAGNRGKKSSRTTANNDDIMSIHGVSLAKILKSPRGKLSIGFGLEKTQQNH
jgi:hypothetical protein